MLSLVAGQHENIVGLRFFCVEPAAVGLELCSGSLHGTVMAKEGKPAGAKRQLGWASEAAAGVAFLHGAGYAHLDIKAANLLVRKEGTLVLTDFGTAESLRGGGPIAVETMSAIHATPRFVFGVFASGVWECVCAWVWSLGVGGWKCCE